MIEPALPLASGFAAATPEAWRALVIKTLKGAGPETLARRTLDGLSIRPLYTAEDSAESAPLVPAPRGGDRPWDIRALVTGPTPSLANAQALEALAGGAASILIRVGASGARLAGPDDLAQVLDGALLDIAPVALDAGFAGPLAARWLAAAAKASPAAPLAFHLDPLSAFALAGASPGPVEAHIEAAATLAAGLADTYPRASLCLATGAIVHEAGGSPAWEIAFAAACGLAYARALSAAGLTVETAFPRIVLGAALDAEPLGAIAKLRALRLVWGRVAEACGAPATPERPAWIEARSSGRMLTRASRWTNLVRLAAAGFGGAVGGADAMVLGAFTDAIGPADPFALRMARNTQLVLMEEAHLGRVADPAAGAWALEAQTLDLARAAWAAFTAIEAAGGAIGALQSGLIATEVERSRQALAAALADRGLRVIGVTDFAMAEDPPPQDMPGPEPAAPGAPLDVSLAGADSVCRPLSPVTLEGLAPPEGLAR